jgi:hypothetical protein
VGVKLVNDTTMDVKPIKTIRVRTEWLEFRVSVWNIEVISILPNELLEVWRRFNHPLGLIENDPGLLSSSRRAVNFGALLSIESEQDDGEAGQKRAFPILS